MFVCRTIFLYGGCITDVGSIATWQHSTRLRLCKYRFPIALLQFNYLLQHIVCITTLSPFRSLNNTVLIKKLTCSSDSRWSRKTDELVRAYQKTLYSGCVQIYQAHTESNQSVQKSPSPERILSISTNIFYQTSKMYS